MSKAKKEKLYVYQSTLSKEYGLTPSMIAELGAPDMECQNPRFRSGWPGRLYLIARVEEYVARNKGRVEEAKERRATRCAARRESLARACAEELQAARDRISSVPILFKGPLPATLLEDAREVWPAPGKDPNGMWLHAYVRHHLTNYESLLGEVKRCPAPGEMYGLLRRRVDPAVAAAIEEWSKSHLPARPAPTARPRPSSRYRKALCA